MKRVGWILIGNKDVPSARIMGLNVDDWMNRNGIWSTLLYQPTVYNPFLPSVDAINEAIGNRFDYLIFQKVCLGKSLEYMRMAKEKGVKTVYILDDLISEGIPLCKEADILVLGSNFINIALKAAGVDRDVVIMPDAYETPMNLCKSEYNPVGRKERVVWFGTPLHFPKAEELRPLVERLGYEYITISSVPEATKKWSLDTVWEDTMTADIVLIPYSGVLPDYEKAKGNNRLTQSMVLGLPVIASPIPAYLPIIRQGKNGFIAFNNEQADFETYLKVLKNWTVRKIIGENARSDVIDRFSIDSIGNIWKEVLK
jgi:hypothetical protein